MLPSVIPRVSEAAAPLQPGMMRVPSANLTTLGLNAEYDGEAGVFSGDLMLVFEGNASAIIEEVGESLIDRLISRSAAASILSGWLRGFRVGIHGRFDFTLTIPDNELHVSGVSLQYREAPSETPARIMEAISNIPALPRSVAIMLEAGSTEYEEVTLKLPSGESADRILISGNISALSDVTYMVGGNPWRIADYELYKKEAVIGGHEYQLLIATNSTLKDVKAEAGKMTVKVEGPSGLIGGLNMLIPKSMLGDAESIGVLVDGEPVGWVLTEEDGNISILVTYPQHENTIEVEWAQPCPYCGLVKYAPYIAAGAAAVVIIAIVIIKKRS